MAQMSKERMIKYEVRGIKLGKFKKLLFGTAVTLLATSSIFTISKIQDTDAAIISVKIIGYSMVDSGKHLDWGHDTAYVSSVRAGAKTWNAYKSGVIREDTATTIQDVWIYDYYQRNNYPGTTTYGSSNTIAFNSYHMDGYNSTKKQHVATHELGHALGLDENLTGDIMDPVANTNVSLTFNDKASYDAAYQKY
ncbi:hypothetical protein ABIA69_002310 [Lysinibacillus parviboronicapiens]|uniref:Peptidase M10 metallopeptidase domain-containing protein n=1 Tax=Lysinibacillus parviboronicapiens TaxID=436516 RepID=A0ABV2PJP8_9BACI